MSLTLVYQKHLAHSWPVPGHINSGRSRQPPGLLGHSRSSSFASLFFSLFPVVQAKRCPPVPATSHPPLAFRLACTPASVSGLSTGIVRQQRASLARPFAGSLPATRPVARAFSPPLVCTLSSSRSSTRCACRSRPGPRTFPAQPSLCPSLVIYWCLLQIQGASLQRPCAVARKLLGAVGFEPPSPDNTVINIEAFFKQGLSSQAIAKRLGTSISPSTGYAEPALPAL
jgi:hypothetical protein